MIELDGIQHLEQEEQDKERASCLESQSYRVIRFWNDQVMNDMEGVIRAIIYALEANGESDEHPSQLSPFGKHEEGDGG